MLLLGGAMIRFDDLHKSISRKIYVPVAGDVMVTRWAYEALMVEEFKSNKFEKPFFNYDMQISQNDWYASFLIPELKAKINECVTAGKEEKYRDYCKMNLRKVKYHLNELSSITGIKPGAWLESVNYDDFSGHTGDQVIEYLDSLGFSLRMAIREINAEKDALYDQMRMAMGNDKLLELREKNYNENLADIVRNTLNKNKILDSDNRLIQKADPIFMKPGSKFGRAHFYAPYKQIGDLKIDTLPFNVIIIWLMTIGLSVTLYFNILKKFIIFLESLKLPLWRKFGRGFLQQ